ncbi:hypothetical protein RUM43_012151 [Polyplax serrata]|uniref:Orange domain-containing protein n=1 Tax=Polyplax serrata TaxID=468196 RepID=A0AAN8PJF9_POLSC
MVLAERPARHSKLEKADILEMTVKHLQQIQRQQLATAIATDPGVVMRFKSGFDECASEVSRYIGGLDGIDTGVKQRLTAHLHHCVSSLQRVVTLPHHNMFSILTQNCDKSAIELPAVSTLPGDVNNNNNNNNNSNSQNGERIQLPGGLQLIPSRLPTGELALLVPNPNQISTFINEPTSLAFQFPTTVLGLNTALSSTLSNGISSTQTNHTSAFTAVNKIKDHHLPSSTADAIKKESEDEFLGTLQGSSAGNHFHQNYNFSVTETLHGDQQERHSLKLYQSNKGVDKSCQSRGKSNGRGCEFTGEIEFDSQKIDYTESSTSFLKNMPDSTTSLLPNEQSAERGFKPFQVEIPNSHLVAQISIPVICDETETTNHIAVQHKPNTNCAINPNRLFQKSPLKHSRSSIVETNVTKWAAQNDMKVESFNKAEEMCPLPFAASENGIIGTGIAFHKKGKRPLSPETSSSNSFVEPAGKTSRISLNVTLTEGNAGVERDRGLGTNRFQRISVIVEDSSRSNVREGGGEVMVNVSSQKDMWRPW